MLSQGNNILDFLPGVRSQTGQNSQAAGSNALPTDQAFPDIFDLLFAGGGAKTPEGDNATINSLLDLKSAFSGQIDDSDFMLAAKEMTAKPEGSDGVLAGVSDEGAQAARSDFSMLFGLGDVTDFQSSQSGAAAFIDEPTTIDGISSDKRQISDVAELLQSQGAFAGQNIRDLLNGQPVEIEAGSYRILDVRVTDNQVILSVESEDGPGSRIKVALPLEQASQMLSDGQSTQITGATETAGKISRVKLDDSAKADAAKMQGLVARLNLKELKIAKVGGTDSGTPEQQKVAADEILNVKITAEKSGEELTLRMNMKAANLHAVKQADGAQTTSSPTDAQAMNDDVAQTDSTKRESSFADTTSGEALKQEPDLETSPKLSRVDKMSDAGNSGITKPDQAHLSSFFDRVSGTRTVLDQQTTPPPVRFSLPDNITSALKTQTRSVLISIEPDNLGPAKLHLAMHNDALTARLTVESIHAKAAVESSLDQLTDQLARAGVKVHHVEVSVSGGDVGSNMLERRPVWNARTKSNTQSIDHLFDLNTTNTTPTMDYRSPGYVRADGVNVFA